MRGESDNRINHCLVVTIEKVLATYLFSRCSQSTKLTNGTLGTLETICSNGLKYITQHATSPYNSSVDSSDA